MIIFGVYVHPAFASPLLHKVNVKIGQGQGMGQVFRDADSTASKSAFRLPRRATAVGASYPFDPGVDGLAGIYASRLLDRGVDPRALCAQIRADRLGVSEHGATIRTLMERPRVSRFGRGTAKHLQVQVQAAQAPSPTRSAPTPVRPPASGVADFGRAARQPAMRWPRRLAAAGLALLILLPLGVLAANAEEAPRQARYIVQDGDTLESVATEFGVDPAAILAASAIQNPPYLTTAEVIVIPDPAESPDTAAWNAFQLQGSSPFVVGAHDVAAGERLADISWSYGLDPLALAAFNGISDVDSLSVGQRLRIPLTDAVTMPDATWTAETLPASSPGEWEESWTEAVGGVSPVWEVPATGPFIAADVPAYMQAYSLSCEYAAAYIATAAFGNGVPESAFMERIGQAVNPHWGYRGDITGAWGGTDDYGVYAEALVPTLNEFGFVADVFYGGDAGSLTARLDAGMPVMTWLGYFGDTSWRQSDEGSYLLAPGMHVVTVYGYDDGGVYLANPGRGSYEYYGWDEFLAKWAVIDGMGLAIAPM